MTRPHGRPALSVLSATAALTAVALAACSPPTTTAEMEEQMRSRPPMEEMLDHYEAMRREMVEALDREIGGLEWYAAPDMLPMGRANCSTEGAITEAQDFHPVGLTADGTYDRSDWDAAVRVVQDIGDRYGFETSGYLIDRPDDVSFIGEDRYGASYTFAMAVNSILTLRTGCHLWEHKPGLDYTRPSPLDSPEPSPGTSTSPPA